MNTQSSYWSCSWPRKRLLQQYHGGSTTTTNEAHISHQESTHQWTNTRVADTQHNTCGDCQQVKSIYSKQKNPVLNDRTPISDDEESLNRRRRTIFSLSFDLDTVGSLAPTTDRTVHWARIVDHMMPGISFAAQLIPLTWHQLTFGETGRVDKAEI